MDKCAIKWQNFAQVGFQLEFVVFANLKFYSSLTDHSHQTQV